MAGWVEAYAQGGPAHGEIREVEHPLPDEAEWWEHHYVLTGQAVTVTSHPLPVYEHDSCWCGHFWDRDDEDPECE